MDLTGAVWRKASRSGTSGDNCVEVAGLGRSVAVRDSKDPAGPKLGLSRSQWSAFVTRAKTGDYDI